MRNGLAMLRGVLDADPNSRIGLVEPLGREWLQDPIMHALLSGGGGGAPSRFVGATRIKEGSICLGSAKRLSCDRASSTLWASFLNFPWSASFPGERVPHLHAICDRKD